MLLRFAESAVEAFTVFARDRCTGWLAVGLPVHPVADTGSLNTATLGGAAELPARGVSSCPTNSDCRGEGCHPVRSGAAPLTAALLCKRKRTARCRGLRLRCRSAAGRSLSLAVVQERVKCIFRCVLWRSAGPGRSRLCRRPPSGRRCCGRLWLQARQQRLLQDDRHLGAYT